jgi:hypothetical protein
MTVALLKGLGKFWFRLKLAGWSDVGTSSTAVPAPGVSAAKQ